MAAKRKQAAGRVSKPDWPDRLRRFRATIWLEVAGLAAISAVVYLIHAGRLTYYRDDWYYMYDGLVGGGRVFVEMFRHLRPARGVLFEFLFGLFGTNPLPYHVLMYVWRLAGGLAALWLFRLLWPAQRAAAFFMALLFLIYPGFLWWVQAFEYQPMALSVSLQTFSIACTLQAVTSRDRRARLLAALAALLTGWACLAFVEYAIGMEVFRWLCLYLVFRRDSPTPWAAVTAAWRAAGSMLLIPIGFLLWRQFIFDNERNAADLGLQLGAVLSSPSAAVWWLVHLVQSWFNTLVLAWVEPFSRFFFALRLRDVIMAGAAALGVLILVYALHRLLPAPVDSSGWQWEAVGLGLVGAAAGLVPIIVANRVVTLDRFSHYTLPVSLAAVVFVVGFVHMLSEARLRLVALATLAGLAALTHFAVAAHARGEEMLIQGFWHQVAWRAPALKPGTLLVVNYSGLDYQEGSDIAWGPANFIYFPDRQDLLPLRVPVAATRMESGTPQQILAGDQFAQTYIVINSLEYDFDNLLVLTMAAENACVRALSAEWAELSSADTALVALSAPKSRIENVELAGERPALPEHVFGPEPVRGWCYFYQQAAAARQRGDWQTIAALDQEIARLGLSPNDPIEWMPFLQAAAALGEGARLKQLSTLVNTDHFYKRQSCANLRAMDLPAAIDQQVSELFCGGG